MRSNTEELTATTNPQVETVVVEANDLGVRLGSRVVLSNIDVAVNRGEVLAIVGGSGSGKSTLMRQLATPTEGSVKVFGMDMSKTDDVDSTTDYCTISRARE